MLLDLQPDTRLQGELDLGCAEEQDRSSLMATLDRVNQRFGKGTVQLASAGIRDDNRAWAIRQQRRTPKYTTRWENMPVVRA